MINEMFLDFKNRVRNLDLKTSDLWYPLFEAVVNSVHSIQENDNGNIGKIDIVISRKQSVLTDCLGEVDSIKIIDNGVGFNEGNYKSFRTSDTSKKLKIGGKGVGRFTWIKVFKSAEIESVYCERGELRKRNFIFTDEGVIQNSIVSLQTKVDPKTTVFLRNMNSEYSKTSDIAINMISDILMKHIAIYLLTNERIEISLIEEKDETRVNLNYDFFNKYIKTDSVTHTYINDCKFNLRHIFSPSKLNNRSNNIQFCAQNRVVWDIDINADIELPDTYIIDGEEYFYTCYITSKMLDDDVSNERLTFNNFIYVKDKSKVGFGAINGYEEINRAIELYLDKHIRIVKEMKDSILRNYITKEEPQYGYLYQQDDYRKLLRQISYGTISSEKKLSDKLREIDTSIYHETRKRIENNNISDEEVQTIANKIKNTSKSSLIEYVVRRKLIIDLLDKKLKINNGDFEYEETVHNILFPMKTALSDIDYNSHNLWLIDERLSYSYDGFSDMQLKKILKLADNTDRPDMIFINSFSKLNDDKSVVDNITIVEIKRPGRNAYEASPTEQIFRYIRAIKESKVIQGYDGEILNVTDEVFFNCYVIGDLTPKLRIKLEDAQFKPVANHERFQLFSSNHNAFVEFVSFRRLLNDAKLRNRIFQKKLEI